MELLQLPEEMVAIIAEFVPVDSALSFALTCKETLRHMKPRLEKNRIYHERYEIQHDRKPLTVATLLRLAIDNPEAAYHIRAFESWGLRPGFNKWRSWEINRALPEVEDEDVNVDWPDGPEDYSMFDESFFEPHEFEQFRSVMTDLLQLGSDDTTEWMQKVHQGWDEPLKGMLFALTPKLDRLNFIAYDAWQGYEHHDKHPLTFLCTSISSVYHALAPGIRWPPGLESLRAISIGTPTDLRHPHDQYHWEPHEIAPLFLLPNIKSLNLVSGYHHGADDFYLPERSSTVEDLGFVCCGDFTPTVWAKLLAAPKHLKIFNVCNSFGYADIDLFGPMFADRFGDSLEILSQDLFPTSLTYLRGFKKLRIIDPLPMPSFLQQDHQHPSQPERRRNNKLQSCLPFSVEKVRFEEVKVCLQNDLLSGLWEEIFLAVADLVDDARFCNLVEVCLSDMAPHVPTFMAENQKSLVECWNSNISATVRIKASGVNTHLDLRESSNARYRDVQTHQNLHAHSPYYRIDNETDPRPPEERQYWQ